MTGPVRVGLTGGIGSGKTAVAALLAERGAIIIDADALAREVVAPGTPGLSSIVEAFGPSVLQSDGSLDRGALASLVFADRAKLETLNGITHPLIASESARLIDSAPDGAVVVYDMPLLVENGLATGWDLVVVVDAPDEVRLRRLEERGLEREDAHRRMAAQATRQERLAVADVVIDNGGTQDALREQVDRLWARIGRPPTGT